MNDQMIAIKIDVTKILKEHLFQGKNGAKYLDILLIPTPDNRYGDSHMAVQSLPKELRDQGQKGPILGNAKPIGGGRRNDEPRQSPRSSPPPANNDAADEDPPF